MILLNEEATKKRVWLLIMCVCERESDLLRLFLMIIFELDVITDTTISFELTSLIFDEYLFIVPDSS